MEKKSIILPETTAINYEFEKMLKTFLKDVDKRGILKEVKARRYYIKPSAIKRAERNKRRK